MLLEATMQVRRMSQRRGKEDNSRFPLTHAAMALYWDKVADIMKSGVVSASSNPPTKRGGVTRDTSDIAMGLMVWLLDFDVIKRKAW